MCVCVAVVDAVVDVRTGCVKQTYRLGCSKVQAKEGNRSAASSAILVQGVGMEVGVVAISMAIFASGASS